MKLLKPLTFILIPILICGSTALAEKPDPVVPVGVSRVQELSEKTAIELSGTALPWAITHLASELDGKVKKLFFHEGQYVTEGTRLVQLDTQPLELERNFAMAEKLRVATQLSELKAGTRKESIDAARATLEKARARLQLTLNELKRTKKLYEDGVLSVNEYDNAKALAEEGQAQFDEMKSILEERVAGPRIEEIQREEANLLAAEATIRIIEDKIHRATIAAPFNGYLIKKETEVGQWLEEGENALTMINDAPPKIEVHLPQYFFNKIKPGTPAKIFLESHHSQNVTETFKGKVIEKIFAGDPASRTFPIRIKINSQKSGVAPGMLVRVELYPPDIKNKSLYVPKDAVVRSPKETLVWLAVPDENKVMKAEKVVVEPGERKDSMIAIKSTENKIKAGDWVVVQGNERLRPDLELKIINKLP